MGVVDLASKYSLKLSLGRGLPVGKFCVAKDSDKGARQQDLHTVNS